MRLPLGWSASGLLLNRELKLSGVNRQDFDPAEVGKKWWDLTSFGFLIVSDEHSRDDELPDEQLNSSVTKRNQNLVIATCQLRTIKFIPI